MNIFERTKSHATAWSHRAFRDDPSAELVCVLALAAANLGTLKAASDLLEKSQGMTHFAANPSLRPDYFGAAVALP